MNKLEEIKQNIERKYVDKTPNSKNKIAITFSVDINVAKRLRKYCEENGRFISWSIERAINDYLEKQNDK